MKGNNDLILNEATMIEAVQFWLDAQMVKPAPKVTGVKAKSSGFNSPDFAITLDSDTERDDQKNPV